MKQRSWKINEQGPDGEEVSHEDAASSRHRVEEWPRNNRRQPNPARKFRRSVEGSISQKQQQKERARSHKQQRNDSETLCIQDQS